MYSYSIGGMPVASSESLAWVILEVDRLIIEAVNNQTSQEYVIYEHKPDGGLLIVDSSYDDD